MNVIIEMEVFTKKKKDVHIFLKSRIREETEIFNLLIDSQNDCSSQGWSRPKPVARTPSGSPKRVPGMQVLAITHCLGGYAFMGSWIEV